MRSSRSEAAAPTAMVAQSAPHRAPHIAPSGADPPGDVPADLDIRQRSRVKRLLPQTMFGRSLLLIVMPLVLVQIIAIWVFYARHWETVSRRLASDVAGDIGMLIEAMRFTDNELELTRLLENASGLTGIDFTVERGATLPQPIPAGGT